MVTTCKAKRSVKVMFKSLCGYYWVIGITQNGECQEYFLRQHTETVFTVEKLHPVESLMYTVDISEVFPCCNCLSFLHCGELKICKHVDALRTLLAAGKLD